MFFKFMIVCFTIWSFSFVPAGWCSVNVVLLFHNDLCYANFYNDPEPMFVSWPTLHMKTFHGPLDPYF